MGKKIKCSSTPRGRKSKDQGGKEIKGRATIYTPGNAQNKRDVERNCGHVKEAQSTQKQRILKTTFLIGLKMYKIDSRTNNSEQSF